MRHSNQGRRLDLVLDDVGRKDLATAAEAGWLEFRNHSGRGSCECLVLEILVQLYELGYRLSRDERTLDS
jgi:hypothetical protein